MKPYLLALLISSQTLIYGASTQVILYSSFETLKDLNGSALSAGSSSDGDGAILQIGYYTSSSNSNPFAGDWVPMSGPGTPYLTTVGDPENRDDGTFKLVVIFTQGIYTFTEPPVGTPLALRFYDSDSLATATYFNAVTDIFGDFNWLAPTDPQSNNPSVTLLLGSSSIWQDGPGSAGRTTIPVPEPSSSALFGLVGVGMLAIRRRKTDYRARRRSCHGA